MGILSIHPWLLLLLESLQRLRVVAERTSQGLATAQCQPVWVHILAVTLRCFLRVSLFPHLLKWVQCALPRMS